MEFSDCADPDISRHPAAPGRRDVHHERRRGLLARLADHQDARRPRPEISRSAVRHRLLIVIYTTPADFSERVWLWCRAGITPGDLQAARDVLRAACWASDVRVVVNDRRSHIVALEVMRRLPARRHAGDPPNPAWPHLDRGQADGGQADGGDAEEPTSYSGPGHLWPFS